MVSTLVFPGAHHITLFGWCLSVMVAISHPEALVEVFLVGLDPGSILTTHVQHVVQGFVLEAESHKVFLGVIDRFEAPAHGQAQGVTSVAGFLVNVVVGGVHVRLPF